jgi:membrane-bound serine protease (ClpP class)
MLLFSFPISLVADKVLLLDIEGIISPATVQYLQKGFKEAKNQNASCIILLLDTPGGFDLSMREIIKNITTSKIPVVTYVYPSGARAASAGTYILYASHIAAMSPGTNLGAATPISFSPISKLGNKDLNRTNAKDTKEAKMTNDAIAYIKSLAQMRGRNIDFAVKAVTESATLSAQEALEQGVIEVVAKNMDDLLNQIDGKLIQINDKEIILHTQNVMQINFQKDFKDKFLATIANPNVAYILLLIGIYGIFFEFLNPGSIGPGVIGAIALVIAMVSLNMLPVNSAGIVLIILGIIFMVTEVFVPSFGILGIGGTISFIIGSLILFKTQTIAYGVSIPLIIAFSITSLLFFIMVVRLVLRSRKMPVVSGYEEMIGKSGKVLKKQKNGHFLMQIHGEVWQAESKEDLVPGESVIVTQMEDLILQIKKDRKD